MTHEIEAVTINGQSIVEAMYANDPAWHGLGSVFDPSGKTAPNSKQAMQAAHLDWTVEKQEIFLPDGSRAGEFFATVRTDRLGTKERHEATLGIVTKKYKILQNSEAFAFLDSLVMDGIMRYESAFAMRAGRQVCLVARMPTVDDYSENDKGLRYVMLRTSHDASCEIEMLPTAVRVVCANTVRLALREGQRYTVTVRHTGDMDEKMKQARKYLSQFNEDFSAYSEAARLLIDTKYSKQVAKDYIEELFPTPDKKASERMKTGHKKKVEAVRKAFRHESNKIDGMAGTFWGLFNAVTFAVDHDKVFNRRRGSDRRKAENRFDSQIDGKSADIKSKALRLARDYALSS